MFVIEIPQNNLWNSFTYDFEMVGEPGVPGKNWQHSVSKLTLSHITIVKIKKKKFFLKIDFIPKNLYNFLRRNILCHHILALSKTYDEIILITAYSANQI